MSFPPRVKHRPRALFCRSSPLSRGRWVPCGRTRWPRAGFPRWGTRPAQARHGPDTGSGLPSRAEPATQIPFLFLSKKCDPSQGSFLFTASLLRNVLGAPRPRRATQTACSASPERSVRGGVPPLDCFRWDEGRLPSCPSPDCFLSTRCFASLHFRAASEAQHGVCP